MKFLEKLRQYLLVKLARDRPLAMNLVLTSGLYLDESTKGGLFINIRVNPELTTAIIIGALK